MKSYETLIGSILSDMGMLCHVSTRLDLKKIMSRVKHEGDSFLTITLPTFAKDFERCLELGYVDPSTFSSFRKNRSWLPAFLQGFTGLVFNARTGLLLDNPSIEAIYAVRQICYLFYKLERPCSDARTAAAFDEYIKCDNQVRDFVISQENRNDFRRVASFLFDHVFSEIDRNVFNCELVPKHGPGATADRLLGNEKFKSKLWTERLERSFPAMDYLYANPSLFYRDMEQGQITWLEPGSEIPVRVISVPKTLKTPRIIAIEPTCMQYAQQALMQQFVEKLEHGNHHASTFIGFTDQHPNQLLAREGSVDGSLATLDLSEASDRVSMSHVEDLFFYHTWLRQAVLDCRSSKAAMPDGTIHDIAKFASMGSALTFPVEAMVFLTIIFIGIERRLNTPVSKEVIKGFRGRVRVYGDDLIVPANYMESVVDSLEAFGLKVNLHKSFGTGKFRESCGKEYYDGNDVSVVKLRRDFPRHRRDTQALVSCISFRNQLYKAGLWQSASYMDTVIRDLKIPYPDVHDTSPALGRHTFLDYQVDKECTRLQRPLVKALVVTDVPSRNPLDGHDALLKFFLKRSDEPLSKDHLRYSGRPRTVRTVTRWATPY